MGYHSTAFIHSMKHRARIAPPCIARPRPVAPPRGCAFPLARPAEGGRGAKARRYRVVG